MIKSFSVIMTVKILNLLRGIIFLPLVVKLLGLHEYGIFSQVVITVAFLMPIITMGLRETCVRYIAHENDKEIIAKKLKTVVKSGSIAKLIRKLSK